MMRYLAYGCSALLVILAFALGPGGKALLGNPTQAEEAQLRGEDRAGFGTLNSGQLAAMLQNKNFTFVNVHIPYEGEIRGTDAHIAFDEITENLDKLPKDKRATIVLYCRSGRMSEIAAGELTRLGYTQVSHLSGGMIDWKSSGYEIVEK
jgi:rhodanese-related sulfurtransferase